MNQEFIYIYVMIALSGCARKYLPLGKKQKVGMDLVVTLRKGVANLPAIGIMKIVLIDRERWRNG